MQWLETVGLKSHTHADTDHHLVHIALVSNMVHCCSCRPHCWYAASQPDAVNSSADRHFHSTVEICAKKQNSVSLREIPRVAENCGPY